MHRLETDAPSPQSKSSTQTVSLDYLSGFIDGDGCIRIEKRTRKDRRSPVYRPVVRCGNVQREVIEQLARQFGGAFNTRADNGRNSKPLYLWTMMQDRDAAFLHTIAPHLFIKWRQALTCIELTQRPLVGIGNGTPPEELEIREQLFVRCKQHNGTPVCPHHGDVSDAYLAGFFDAEGSIAIKAVKATNSYAVVIAASNDCACILKKFSERFGGFVTRTRPHKWQAACISAHKALVAMVPYLIVKRERATVAIKFRPLIPERPTGHRIPKETLSLMR